MRPHAQAARRIGARDAAAAGADRVDAHHRHPHRPAADPALQHDQRRARGDQRDVGTGAADVDRDDVGLAGARPLRAAADHAAGGTGEEQPHRTLPRDRARRDAAAGLHQLQRHADPHLAQAPLQPLQIAADHRLDIGIERGDDGAFVFAKAGIDLARQRHRDLRPLARDQRPRPALVRGVEEGEQKADRDRFHPVRHQGRNGVAHRALVQRHQHATLRVDALDDLLAPSARQQEYRGRRAQLRRIHRVADLPADLQHVAEAGGREQADAGTLFFQHRVGADRGAVDDARDPMRRDAALVDDPAQTGDDRLARIGGRGGNLEQARGFAVCPGDDVGEGAAGVDADLHCGSECSTPLVHRQAGREVARVAHPGGGGGSRASALASLATKGPPIMRIGCPSEIKNNEYRVGLTPAGARELVAHGHTVVMQSGAGAAIGFPDTAYRNGGAEIVGDAAAVFATAEMVVKVKEPQRSEIAMLRPGQVLFTYLHLAPDPEQTQGLLASGCTAIAYETVTDAAGRLPLLAPMSEVAGRMSVQVGAHCLERAQGGAGVLLGGVPGVLPAKVVVLGGGVSGTNAARGAAGLGADVIVLDRSLARLTELEERFGDRFRTAFATAAAVEQHVLAADLVIGAVLVPGAAAPKLVTRAMLATHAARQRAGRYQHRPGRLLRDQPPDHARGPDFRGGRRRALLRRQHAGRGRPHQHAGPDQRDPALRADAGG